MNNGAHTSYVPRLSKSAFFAYSFAVRLPSFASSRWLRLCAACVAFAGFALGSTRAKADTSHKARLVYLRGIGTETCPPEAELSDAVAARLGYEPFSTWAQDTLFVELTKDAQGFTAKVKLVDSGSNVRGERELHARNACADLVPTMALTISLAIDPMASARNGALPEDTPPREKPVDLDAGAPPSPPLTDAGEARHMDENMHDPQPHAEQSLALGVGVLGSVGSAPAPNVGLSLFAEGRYAWLSIGLEGRVDLPSSASVDHVVAVSGASPEVSSWLLVGELRACGHVRGAFGCVLGIAGELHASGIDVSSPREAGALYGATGLRAGYDYDIVPRFALRGQIEGDLVLTRYALSVGGVEAYRYAPIAGNVGVLGVVRFQ